MPPMNKTVPKIKLHSEDYFGAMIAGWLMRSSDVRIANTNSIAVKGSQ